MENKLYMSVQQVDQVYDTHYEYLTKLVNENKMTRQAAQAELVKLRRWATAHYPY